MGIGCLKEGPLSFCPRFASPVILHYASKNQGEGKRIVQAEKENKIINSLMSTQQENRVSTTVLTIGKRQKI
jgi:hypothetical protein